MNDRISVFKQMLESEPDNTMVLFGLANEYLKLKAHKEAIEVLEKYLSFGTDEGAGYGMLAQAFENTEEPARAIAAYKKGVEVSIANGHPSMAAEYNNMIEMISVE